MVTASPSVLVAWHSYKPADSSVTARMLSEHDPSSTLDIFIFAETLTSFLSFNLIFNKKLFHRHSYRSIRFATFMTLSF